MALADGGPVGKSCLAISHTAGFRAAQSRRSRQQTRFVFQACDGVGARLAKPEGLPPASMGGPYSAQCGLRPLDAAAARSKISAVKLVRKPKRVRRNRQCYEGF
jgi:hypothetical protein